MWKEQKSGTRGVAECVTDVLTTFWRLLWFITESDARQHAIYLFYKITKSLFYFKIFQHNAKAGLLPRLCAAFARKRAISLDLCLFTMTQFHWLLCVAKNCDCSRKIAPLSIAPRWTKTYSEGRIELRNLQILKKMLEKSSQFLSSEQPSEPKSLDVALKISGVEKYPCGYGQPRSHLIRVLNERSVNDCGVFVFCGWWFPNQLDIVPESHFSCDTVDRGLWLATLSSLLCPETDRNIRIGEQGYVFYFTDFKKWCFDVSFLTSISVSTVVLKLGKVEFFK